MSLIFEPSAQEMAIVADRRDLLDAAIITTRVATKKGLLEFANQVREAGGGSVIDELLPGIREDADSCLIANALNFDCEVTFTRRYNDFPDGSTQWYMDIRGDYKVALNIAEKCELVIGSISRGPSQSNVHLLLPKYIGNAAAAFDDKAAFQDFGSMTHASREELIDFANEVRSVGGAEPITELIPGYSGSGSKCLIAKALNFECTIDKVRLDGQPHWESGNAVWGMRVSTELGNKIGSALKLTVTDFLPGTVIVHLPEKIGNAAAAFDKGIDFQDLNLYNYGGAEIKL